MSSLDDDIGNLVLLSLPQATLKRIRPALEWRETKRGEIVQRAGAPHEFVSFINGGLVSLVKDMRDGRTVEVGEVGIEGIVAPAALFGLNQSVVDAVVEIPGSIMRLKHGILRREMERDRALHDLVSKCARYSLIQLVQIAACNRLHSYRGALLPLAADRSRQMSGRIPSRSRRNIWRCCLACSEPE
jgi:CRP-like cAMP-binding protein